MVEFLCTGLLSVRLGIWRVQFFRFEKERWSSEDSYGCEGRCKKVSEEGEDVDEVQEAEDIEADARPQVSEKVASE